MDFASTSAMSDGGTLILPYRYSVVNVHFQRRKCSTLSDASVQFKRLKCSISDGAGVQLERHMHDAILDRIIHISHTIKIAGKDSMRKRKGMTE